MRHSWYLLVLAALGCQVVRAPISGRGFHCFPLTVQNPAWTYYEECREFFVQTHPELSEERKAAILEGRVVKGMNKDEVRASMGNLEGQSYFISHELDETGTSREVWCYPRVIAIEYVTFADGKVITHR